MMYGLSTIELVSVGFVGLAFLAVVVSAVLNARGGDEEFPERDEDGELPDEVDLEPPTLRGSRFGTLGELVKTWRYLRKTERLAGRGYVQWYCIDDTWPTPKFVKPEDEGAGVREYETDDGIYLFPEEARKPSAETGMWTFVHQKHDPEPVNVIDHRETVFTSEQAKSWLAQVVTAERPSGGMFGWLSDMSSSQLMALAIGVTVIVAVILGNTGGA